MIALAALAAAATGLMSSCRAKYPDGLYAEVKTNKGPIVLSLEFEKTPLTAASFVGLAEGTIDNAAFPAGRPYFDGTKWYRVVPGHVIQCGIPAGSKDRDGGPGYEFPNEIVLPELNHGRAGMVNMANDGPHTNGSQWCITLGDRSYLDGDYTVFGHVVEGMDTVFKIVQGDGIESLRIVRVGRAAKAFHPTTASFKEMTAAAWAGVAAADARKKAEEEALIVKNWPDLVSLPSGLRYKMIKEGNGPVAAAGDMLKAAYSGHCLLVDKAFVSTAEQGGPYWGTAPETFAYTMGGSKINAGLDATLSAMKKGEKRLVIVPASLGYGKNGYYAKARPNDKRFVISPGTVLVYEIELLDITRAPKSK